LHAAIDPHHAARRHRERQATAAVGACL
jgi:hypothetical protein